VLHERISALRPRLADAELEMVLVDDGSTDRSVDVIRSLPATGLPVRLVRFSRNFGSHAALAAGVAHATGNVLTFLSADLQDPPELLLDLWNRRCEGYEIVWATREAREDGAVTRLFSRLYYGLLRRWALPQMPPGGVDLCLVDRQVVESLGNLQERNSNIFNLLMWAGFRQAFVPYRRTARKAGRSKWTLGKKLKLFIDSFVAFSFLPMRLISGLGAVFSLLGLVYATVIVIRQLLWGVAIQGWSSLMVVILLSSGVQLLMLGVLSEYLWRSLDAARNRPTYIVRETEWVAGQPAERSG
jgi:dolichol-phosphate mannosyltransferase